MNEATRFKLAIGLIVTYLVEAVIKALLPAFPFEVTIGAQGAIGAYYFTVRTVNDVKAMKYNCANGEPKP